MKSLGILRRIDELGRIVLPKELRSAFDIRPGDSIEIYTDRDNAIILKKYQHKCIFCGSNDDLVEYKGRMVCQDCVDDIESMNH
ncbi:MAG: AbrB/MazE/SpoVT family DNA-binding domain-containing protein [Oscillospiraceae bacterium]|nr:AbrB/MazE/SpoVT family DNA-binding domain-containing protein [Oscillospiraceae bacterium]